ncbi:MFS transporter [Larsenimonas suaedae]|uniref:Uncharacterized MFS-type transporter QC825_00635 n=1 Tax=Larsenimonas suaedae TaxID=1851019 RepID=A0ABU1GRB7_9GAMM|nr:MFS transporter [Larsenimonas suaedae]MCM2972630.1 MFS transporter [Larsenimonas suaedae]MDR5894573.1 MFS transporter [Larsenimonas suaedae]
MPSDSNTSLTQNLRIIAIVSSTFVSMLCIGMTLTVLPPWIHDRLGYASITVGAVISLQFLVTLMTRPFSGRLADLLGAKRIVLSGLVGCAASGVFIALAALFESQPGPALACLIISRVLLGVSQGMIGTGTLSWGIGLMPAPLMGKVISWNGIAGYGALALGAPLGAVIAGAQGVAAMGLVIALVALMALVTSLKRPASPIVSGERAPFRRVFRVVAPYGLTLALSAIGYGVIATFITLYYADKGWSNAALGLSAFGTAFIVARLLFANTITRFGGYRVTLVCFMVELAGLSMLWLAESSSAALIGATLTGLGVSLIYPALGVVAVAKISASNRSAALGAYSVFLDAAVGVTGPAAGVIAGYFGYSAIFLAAALGSLFGLVLCAGLFENSRRRRARSA